MPTTCTGGHPLGAPGHAPAGRQGGRIQPREGLPLAADIAGTSSVLVLAARAVAETPPQVRASIGAVEVA